MKETPASPLSRLLPLLLLAVLPALPACSPPEVREVRKAMGTDLEIQAYDSDRARAREAVAAAFAEVEEVEALLSTWRRDSEILRLNRLAGRNLLRVDPRTFEVLRLSKELSRESDGAFDVTVGPLMRVWQLHEGGVRPYPPVQEEVDAALRAVGSQNILLNDADGSVGLLRAGMEIDLGGIGKGYAIDRAVGVLRARGVPAALVRFPGDLRAYGKPPRGPEWTFEIPHPREKGRALALVSFPEGALSTSADSVKTITVRLEKKSYPHIVSPRTGKPVEGMASATVWAPTASESDALATAAFVLGPGLGKDLLAARPGVEGILLACDPKNPERLKTPSVTPGWAEKVKLRAD